MIIRRVASVEHLLDLGAKHAAGEIYTYEEYEAYGADKERCGAINALIAIRGLGCRMIPAALVAEIDARVAKISASLGKGEGE